jgi:hypothetical protein
VDNPPQSQHPTLAAVLEVHVLCGVGGCCCWAGIHLPAAAAACQSFFYDFYKKLTELSANNFRLLFCWPGWSLVASPSSAVTSWCGSSGDKQGGEPAPEIQIDPAAFVFHKTERLTICFFLYGWTGQQPGSGFFNLAPSILHYNWF